MQNSSLVACCIYKKGMERMTNMVTTVVCLLISPFIAIADFIHERRTIKKGGERNENNESC